jgi:hypothetical protein
MDAAREMVRKIIKGRVLVGHALRNDLTVRILFPPTSPVMGAQ